MQKRHWAQTTLSLLLIRSLLLAAYAQDIVSTPAANEAPAAVSHRASAKSTTKGQGYGGFQHKLEQAVGLTPEQREAVRGLLAQQHEQLRSLREGIEPKYASVQEQTDSKIRALLNPEQQKKFDTFLAQQKQSRNARYRRSS
jgi:Spy/CpxP family protein refolding chaperone